MEKQQQQDDNFRMLAAELAKESGYRIVEYGRKGVFLVDYQIGGVLNHAFAFPYNYDTHVVLPWLPVEVRGKDVVRIKGARLRASRHRRHGGHGQQCERDGRLPDARPRTRSPA